MPCLGRRGTEWPPEPGEKGPPWKRLRLGGKKKTGVDMGGTGGG